MSSFARRTTNRTPAAPSLITTHPILPFRQFLHPTSHDLHTLTPRLRPTADPVNATAINSAHPSDMAADRLTADLSTMDISARLSNLPVPRELRDMIYTYLLNSDYTRVPRKYDEVSEQQNLEHNQPGPKAYHFHTNILAVNHEIHTEAEELLYKENTFVVVSYKWPSLGKVRGGLLWVPIVSKQNASKMKLHSLRIHVDPGPIALRDAPRKPNTGVPVEFYIVLAGDVKAFCATMQVPDFSHSGAAILVSTVPGPVPALSIAGLNDADQFYEPTSMMCQLRDTKYGSMTRTLQDYLLSPLASVISMSQKVSFIGDICNQEQVEYLKRVMGPSLVCQNAILWFIYEECELAKEVTDETLEHDDLGFTIHLYRSILSRFHTKLRNFTAEGHTILQAISREDEVLKMIDTFTVEFLVAIALGELKLGHIDAFVASFLRMNELLNKWGTNSGTHGSLVATEGVMDRIYSVVVYYYLYAPRREPDHDPFDSIAAWTAKIPSSERKDKAIWPRLTHDLGILTRHPDQSVNFTAKELPLDQCANSCLPFTPTSFYKTVECAAMHKGHYSGWQDADFLRALSSHAKKQITVSQEVYGLEMTDFTQL